MNAETLARRTAAAAVYGDFLTAASAPRVADWSLWALRLADHLRLLLDAPDGHPEPGPEPDAPALALALTVTPEQLDTLLRALCDAITDCHERAGARCAACARRPADLRCADHAADMAAAGRYQAVEHHLIEQAARARHELAAPRPEGR